MHIRAQTHQWRTSTVLIMLSCKWVCPVYVPYNMYSIKTAFLKWSACPVAVLWPGGLFTAAAHYRLSHCFTFSARFTLSFFLFSSFCFWVEMFGLKLPVINTSSQWYICTWKSRKISCLSQTFNQREEEKEEKFGHYVTGESLFWNPVAFEVGW